jgi:hypothetical protein
VPPKKKKKAVPVTSSAMEATDVFITVVEIPRYVLF